MIKRLCCLSLVLLMVAGCDALVTDSFPGSAFFEDAEEVPFSEVKKDHYANLEVEAQNRVIRQEEVFREMWNKLNADHSPVPEVPEIDFEERMVLLAVMGQRSTGGYDLRIEKVAAADGELGVHLVKIEAGDNCITTQALTNTMHIVTVPASSAEVTFYEDKTIKECNQ